MEVEFTIEYDQNGNVTRLKYSKIEQKTQAGKLK